MTEENKPEKNDEAVEVPAPTVEEVAPPAEELAPPIQESMLPEDEGALAPPEEFDAGPNQVGDQAIDNAGEPEVEDESFNLDETDENAPDFEPIPLGWYEHTITDAKYKPSKGGDPMMVISFTMTDEKQPKYLGRQVSLFALFRYQGKPFDLGKKHFKKAMVRSGVEIDWANFKPVTFVKSGIALGKRVRLKLGIGDPYQNAEGEMVRSNTIKDYQAVGSVDSFLADTPT